MIRTRCSSFACLFVLLPALLALPRVTTGQEAAEDHPLSGMPLREIGPALTSGRVADFAIDPRRAQVWYVAMASSGVWKTDNAGTTWRPLFDDQGAYATGVVALDPHNPDSVWVGTGENNSQRSVGYGDGVYRSRDGGQSWERMGLETSGHISMIRFHPDRPGTVYVAAQGPLWSDGGQRGLYRSEDHGDSWEPLLEIDEFTGANEFLLHEDSPDIMLASTYQRRRHVWTLINGGPGSGLHKSEDGGRSWRRLTKGLPEGDLGRIGLAAASSAPGVVYAIIEADEEGRGVYRSTDFGESWEKRSSHMTTSPQYYNELVVDPHDPDRVYALDTFTHVSEDGGKSWQRLPFKHRHVDDHALWIDPEHKGHLLIGGDGGIYESWDGGQSWRHFGNLPVTQFYRATPDNDRPFYNVCAGTQDNHTLCGPSRTTFTDGITNADWWISQFGDGFKTRFDPENPAIVYSQYQYGGLNRFDRITGEALSITPQPSADEDAYRWNWNAPLIVSPHDPQRLYYGAERLFRSDDRGASWETVSPDLSRGLDRNTLQVMGRVWSVDAIAKNMSTSPYGSIVALDESPLEEGLLYAGTDDGLLWVTRNGGDDWDRLDSVPGVPQQALVEDLAASNHDPNVAYAVVDNHKRGDYRPYVLKSSNRGRSWTLISGNLPERGSAHTIVEDPGDPNLLFVGTEFGLFFTASGGRRWHRLTALPTVAVRDLEIQPRERDLVIGTFGRGVWILDDYRPLRADTAALASGPRLFASRDAWLFVPDPRRGWGGRGDYGQAKFAADNPPHGAVFTYYLPEPLQTAEQVRREQERERSETGGDNPYPSWDALRAEDREPDPAVLLTIEDSEGRVVRRLTGPVTRGLHRIAWDLRHPAPDPIELGEDDDRSPWQRPPQGPLAVPGEYRARLALRRSGVDEPLDQTVSFRVKPLSTGGLVAEDPAEVLDFQQRSATLFRAVSGLEGGTGELESRIDHLQQALDQTPLATDGHRQRLATLRSRLLDLKVGLAGDRTRMARAAPAPLALSARTDYLLDGYWSSRTAVPGEYLESIAVAEAQLQQLLSVATTLRTDLASLEEELEGLGAPWTPGRLPRVD